ncbi:hypothetical protein [Pseudomonas serbica]|uniref:hypothetical protein n=1 Tax=Pseudomonas serbica TaxID=2965074 RepID=UPI00237BEBEA|nr:hypothetical protein [Pseudomonas serbica]
MAIKPATIEASLSFFPKPYALVFAQHYTTKWQTDRILKDETDWFRFNFNTKEQLLQALLNPEDKLREVKEYFVREAAAKTFKHLVANKFVVGFDARRGYTVDALDKRHLKLLAKTPEAGLYPQEPDAGPAK